MKVIYDIYILYNIGGIVILEGAGPTSVCSEAGGMAAWCQAGRPVKICIAPGQSAGRPAGPGQMSAGPGQNSAKVKCRALATILRPAALAGRADTLTRTR